MILTSIGSKIRVPALIKISREPCKRINSKFKWMKIRVMNMSLMLGDRELTIMEEVDNPQPTITKTKIWLPKLVEEQL